MADEDLDDKTAGSSSAHETESGATATEPTDLDHAAPADGAAETQAGGGQSADGSEPKVVPADKNKHSVEDALAFLTEETKSPDGKKKPDAEGDKPPAKVEPKDKSKEQKKPDEKAIDLKAEDQLLPEDRQAPRRTQRRLEGILKDRATIRSERDDLKAKFEQAQPHVKNGENWDKFVKAHELADDMSVLNDDEGAEALKFQAAVLRLSTGKGSKADRDRVVSVYETLDHTRQVLDIPGSKSQAAAPVDLSKLEEAITAGAESLDFEPVIAALKALKESQAAAAKAAPVVQQKQQTQTIPLERQIAAERQQQKQQTTQDSPEERLYESRAERYLHENGLKPEEAVKYVGEKLLPLIYSDLRTAYPGKNPVVVWNSLSPRAKHDLTVDAHDRVRKQTAALKPVAKPKAEIRSSLSSGDNAKGAWAREKVSASNSESAINRLAAAE